MKLKPLHYYASCKSHDPCLLGITVSWKDWVKLALVYSFICALVNPFKCFFYCASESDAWILSYFTAPLFSWLIFHHIPIEGYFYGIMLSACIEWVCFSVGWTNTEGESSVACLADYKGLFYPGVWCPFYFLSLLPPLICPFFLFLTCLQPYFFLNPLF